MVEALSKIVFATAGGVAALMGQALLKHFDYRRAERVAEGTEQKKVAQELLQRIERFCSEAMRRRWNASKAPSAFYDVPMQQLCEEVSSRSLEPIS